MLEGFLGGLLTVVLQAVVQYLIAFLNQFAGGLENLAAIVSLLG